MRKSPGLGAQGGSGAVPRTQAARDTIVVTRAVGPSAFGDWERSVLRVASGHEYHFRSALTSPPPLSRCFCLVQIAKPRNPSPPHLPACLPASGDSPEKVAALLQEQLAALAEGGVAGGELGRVVRSSRAGLLGAAQSNSAMAAALASYHVSTGGCGGGGGGWVGGEFGGWGKLGAGGGAEVCYLTAQWPNQNPTKQWTHIPSYSLYPVLDFPCLALQPLHTPTPRPPSNPAPLRR